MTFNTETTLVATLGGQPQIITFTLDLLLSQGIFVDQVMVVYLASSPRYQEAFRQLSLEFPGDRYQGQVCRLRRSAISLGQEMLSEAVTPAQVDAVWQTFDRLFADLKSQNQQVHLSLTGGRRILSLVAFSVAMLHLTPNDRVWHLYTPPDVTEQVKDGAAMHVPVENGIRLISVPLVPWASYFPGLRPLLGRSPAVQNLAGLPWQDDAERTRCQQVWQQLSRREQDALRCFADGLSRQETANRLGVAVSTGDTYHKKILRRCREVWSDADVARPGFLRERFGPFLRSGQV